MHCVGEQAQEVSSGLVCDCRGLVLNKLYRKWTSNDLGASPQLGKGGLPFNKPSVFPMSAAPPYAPMRKESVSEHVPHALCELQ